MRQGSNPRRSRGRGPRKPHATTKQTFDSNGPDVRVRGSAYQVLEKYLAMARDATSAGDRISAENYLQHAEHYFRILNSVGEQHGPNGRHRGNGRFDANGANRGNTGGDPDSGRRGPAQDAGEQGARERPPGVQASGEKASGNQPADGDSNAEQAEESTDGIT